MIVGAVNSYINPFDVATTAGLRARADHADSQQNRNQTSATQNAAQQSERVVQGEVLSRQRLENSSTATTNDSLAYRSFQQDLQQQQGRGYNSRLALNTYITNQFYGERIDQLQSTDSLIDEYV